MLIFSYFVLLFVFGLKMDNLFRIFILNGSSLRGALSIMDIERNTCYNEDSVRNLTDTPSTIGIYKNHIPAALKAFADKNIK